MTPDQFSASVERLEGYCAEQGRDAAPLARALVQFFNVCDDPAEARRVAIERQSVSYGIDFTPFVDRYVITGTPAMCAARVSEYVAAGVRHLVFNWACPPGDVRRSLRRLAEEVLPQVAAGTSSLTPS
jgi:alkanesulfonate monooxygenase SsuD/methylene tetrahydromethanopterin reductase-like flavin-dependent oxidoreductase (luciferase family)